MAPVSDRWRSTSPTKNGLPSVSRYSAWASPTPSVIEIVAGGRLHEGEHPGVVQAGELDAAHSGFAAQRGQGLGQRVGARELRVAIGADDEQTQGCGVGHHVTQHLEAGLVRPLQVVEHQHEWLVLSRLGEQPDHGVVEEVALGFRVGALGRRQFPETLAQGGDDLGQFGAEGCTWARKASSDAWVTWWERASTKGP